MELSLSASGLAMTFNRRIIFRDVSFSLSAGKTLLITGRNGSGKSTLVKILAGLLSPSRGRVVVDGSGPGNSAQRLALFGMVSPYLQLYDEFTGKENLRLALDIRGLPGGDEELEELLNLVNLYPRRNDFVRTYSSGMKQRIKYAFALVHRPSILLLDEPMANLDAEGSALARAVMARQRERGMLVVATNDRSDVEGSDLQVNLDERH